MLRFRRITTQKRFIPEIDGLRFVAISSVVLLHIYAALETGSVALPWTMDVDLPKRGVELFFAISGFILGVPFASHRLLQAPRVNLKQYFLRRLTRLEPPYFISLFVWAADQMIMGHRHLREMGPHLLASFAYLHNAFFGAFPGAINMVAWSLEIEIQFYVLMPLLALVFTIPSASIRRSTIAVLMLVSGLLSTDAYRNLHLRASIAYYLAFFLAGFLVCDLYLTRKDWKPSFLWDALALCGWPLVWSPLPRNFSHVLMPFLIVMLYLAAFRGKICSAMLSNRIVTDIGGMCYSIYLFHVLVISAVRHVSAPLRVGHYFWMYYGLQALVILPCVLISCGAFFLLIERPCMDREWPRKLWRSWRDLLASDANPFIRRRASVHSK